MSRKLPVTIIILAIVGAAYLIANLTLGNLLSQERLRIMLVEPVEEQLGRKIEIGSIKVSLFSGIDLKDIVVREKDPAQEFVSISNFRLEYALLPLFKKRLVIREVLIDKPTVRIVRNAQGIFNYADLSLKPRNIQKEVPPPELQTVEPLPLTLIFDQIRINDLNLTFTDRTGELPAITSSDGDLTFAVKLGATPADAKYNGTMALIVNSEFQGRKPVLLLEGEFSDQLIDFKGELNVEFDRLFFSGRLAGPWAAPDLTLDLQGSSLDLGKLVGHPPAGRRPGGANIPAAPAPAGPQPGDKKFLVHGKVSINEVRRDGLTLQNLDLTYSFADKALEISNFTAGLFGGTISGKAGVELGLPIPAFRGQFKADQLQMGAAMAALGKPSGYLTGTLSGDLFGRGSGSGWAAIRDKLEGQARVTVLNGGLADSPLSRALAGLLGIPELANLKFDKLTAVMTATSGQASLDADLTAKPLSLQAKGRIGLDGSLDLPMVARLSQENSRRLQGRASFTRYLADDSGRISLNLKLMGTVSQPDLSLSGEGAGKQIKNALGKKAGEELRRSLSRKLGGLDSQNQKAVGETADQLLNKLLGN